MLTTPKNTFGRECTALREKEEKDYMTFPCSTNGVDMSTGSVT